MFAKTTVALWLCLLPAVLANASFDGGSRMMDRLEKDAADNKRSLTTNIKEKKTEAHALSSSFEEQKKTRDDGDEDDEEISVKARNPFNRHSTTTKKADMPTTAAISRSSMNLKELFGDNVPIADTTVDRTRPTKLRRKFHGARHHNENNDRVRRTQENGNDNKNDVVSNRNLQSSALDACMQTRLVEEQDGFSCECLEGENGSYKLLCNDPCDYCVTTDGITCADYQFSLEFDANGNSVSESDILMNQDTQDQVEVIYGDNFCVLEVNGQECSSCGYMTNCGPSNDEGIQVFCPEIEQGLAFSVCFDDEFTNTIPNDSVVGFLAYSVEICEVTPLQECYDVLDNYFGQQDCRCVSADDTSSVVNLECVDTCGVYCNNQTSVCTSTKTERPFGDASAPDVHTYQYVLGRDDTVTLYLYGAERDIFGNANYDSCEIDVNGGLCNSCAPQTCIDNFGFVSRQGAVVDCENIESGASYNLCDDNLVIEDGIFEYFTTNEFNHCATLGQRRCDEASALYENDPDAEWYCTCTTEFTENTELSCVDTCGEKCNAAGDVCGRDEFVQVYSPMGVLLKTEQIFKYSIGRSEEISIEINPLGCIASVDTESCNSCVLTSCDGVSRDVPYVDCSNLLEDGSGVLDFCADNPNVDDTPLFLFADPNGLGDCVYLSPDNSVCSDAATALTPDGSVVIGSTELAFPTLLESETCSFYADDLPSLWYTVIGNGGGMVASTCDESTDFDTFVEIYEGSCDALTCVTDDDDYELCSHRAGPSRASWYAKEGVVYHVRVRGFAGTVGTFGLSIQDVNYPLDVCRQKASREEAIATILEGVSCDCQANGELEATLSCTENCEYCNNETSSCVSETFGQVYDEFGIRTTATYGSSYTKGEAANLQLEMFDCDDFGCFSCRLLVNGQECNSCTQTYCVGPDVFFEDGFMFDCENIEAGATFSTCDQSSVPDTGVFEVFSPSEYNTCIQDPVQACATYLQSQAQVGSDCSCLADASGASLTCGDPLCVYCNEEETICAESTFGTSFNSIGQIETDYRRYEYVFGLDDVITVTDVGDFESCGATFNGEACSCEIITCEAGHTAERFDCGVGGTYDSCTDESSSEVLEILDLSNFFCRDPNFDPAAACENEKSFYPFSDCACTANMETGGQTLRCEDPGCLYCNEERNVCAEKVFGSEIRRYGSQTYYGGFIYEDSGLFVSATNVYFEETDNYCDLPSVDGVACNGCSEVRCAGDSGFYTVDAYDCENIEEGATFGGNCDFTIDVETGIFEALSSEEFNVCLDPTADAEDECNTRANLEAQFGGICQCIFDDVYKSYTLTCEYPACEKCDEDADYCGIDISGAEISRFAEIRNSYTGFKFTRGSTASVTIVEDFDLESLAYTCTAAVDGEECSSCEFKNCPDAASGFPYNARVATCGGTVYSECEEDWGKPGVLRISSGSAPFQCSEDPFEQCGLAKAEIENAEPGTVCRCDANDDDGVDLLCREEECQYCTADQSTCVIDVGTGYVFNTAGKYDGDLSYLKFVQGRNEHVEIEFFGTDDCIVRVDGEFCASCVPVECTNPDGTVEAYSEVDCGIHGTINCDTATGVFEPVANDNLVDYQDCIPYDGTYPPLPTDAPTMAPSFTPSAEPSSEPTTSPSASPSTRPTPPPFVAPVAPTPAPVAPTPAPVSPTPAPVAPTQAPVTTTRATSASANFAAPVVWVTTILGVFVTLLIN